MIRRITISLLMFPLFFLTLCSSDDESPTKPPAQTNAPTASPSATATASPSPTTPGTLIINEVSSRWYSDDPVWVEIFNNSSSTVDLSTYKLRCWGKDATSKAITTQPVIFDLPSSLIQPGKYILLRGKAYSQFVNGSNVFYLINASNIIPEWRINGFVELISNNETKDFVRFGSDAVQPSTLSEWTSSNAPAIPSTSINDLGKSLARNGSSIDSNSSTDWTVSNFATPGGPNDVTSTTDADLDGIPDSCEVPGSTFAGLPLYDWGARQGQKDIFIHIDYMESSDPGVMPRKEALDKVKQVFNNHGYVLHFDTGMLFGTGLNNYNLDNTSHQVPFSNGINFNGSNGCANIYAYKNTYFPIAKRQIFYYLIMGYTQQSDGSSGSSGVAEINGNDLIVSLGNWGFTTDTSENTAYLINSQAATIMHEFGHNIGLRHGGNEDNNYKPNYVSTMNYMYQLSGLPTIGNAEGDRYYYYRFRRVDSSSASSNFYSYFTTAPYSKNLTNNPYSANFIMDYSNGSSGAISELSISEPLGLYRSGSIAVDYNGILGSSETISFNLNPYQSSTVLNDTSIGTLNDYNDWANINIIFQKKWGGNASGDRNKFDIQKDLFIYPDIIGNDKQELIIETLTPQDK